MFYYLLLVGVFSSIFIGCSSSDNETKLAITQEGNKIGISDIET